MVVSPNYYKDTVESPTIKSLKTICKAAKLPLLDFSNDLTFINNPALFFDLDHMNQDGANKFSQLVASKIKNSIILTAN